MQMFSWLANTKFWIKKKLTQHICHHIFIIIFAPAQHNSYCIFKFAPDVVEDRIISYGSFLWTTEAFPLIAVYYSSWCPSHRSVAELICICVLALLWLWQQPDFFQPTDQFFLMAWSQHGFNYLLIKSWFAKRVFTQLKTCGYPYY